MRAVFASTRTIPSSSGWEYEALRRLRGLALFEYGASSRLRRSSDT
jgi:hypothetical protein